MRHLLTDKFTTEARIKELEWVLKIHLERSSAKPNFRERIKHRIDYLQAKMEVKEPNLIKRTPKRLAEWGKIGGQAKVRKGIAVYLERMTPEERAEFYAKRAAKRWKKDKVE